MDYVWTWRGEIRTFYVYYNRINKLRRDKHG